MDILRRNTDYALRAMSHLAIHWKEGFSSARKLACEEDISYPLVRKLLQRLLKANLVKSTIGSRGGFRLSKQPSKINLLEIIETIQGPLQLSGCLLGPDICSRRKGCSVNKKLAKLQRDMTQYLRGITLDDL
jgi:Rrf2 family protein